MVLGRGYLWTVPVSQYPDLADRHMLWGLDSVFFTLVPLCSFLYYLLLFSLALNFLAPKWPAFGPARRRKVWGELSRLIVWEQIVFWSPRKR